MNIITEKESNEYFLIWEFDGTLNEAFLEGINYVEQKIPKTSIEFGEWLGYQNYQYSKKHGQWVNFPDCYTTKELYHKFILENGTY